MSSLVVGMAVASQLSACDNAAAQEAMTIARSADVAEDGEEFDPSVFTCISMSGGPPSL